MNTITDTDADDYTGRSCLPQRFHPAGFALVKDRNRLEVRRVMGTWFERVHTCISTKEEYAASGRAGDDADGQFQCLVDVRQTPPML